MCTAGVIISTAAKDSNGGHGECRGQVKSS
jgi:hypothetical protein